MAVCDVVNSSAEKVGEIEVKDDLILEDVKVSVLHDVVCMQRANRRAGTACTKTRGEVRGGGAKPWRQKGTGRARAGSNRSPVWRGGGTTFGPKPRSYAYSMPKKVRRLALRMAISARHGEGNMVIVDSLGLENIKTADFVRVMNNFDFQDCLVVTAGEDQVVQKSARNTKSFKVLPVEGLNVYDILKHSKIMFTQDSLPKLEERLLV